MRCRRCGQSERVLDGRVPSSVINMGDQPGKASVLQAGGEPHLRIRHDGDLAREGVITFGAYHNRVLPRGELEVYRGIAYKVAVYCDIGVLRRSGKDDRTTRYVTRRGQ